MSINIQAKRGIKDIEKLIYCLTKHSQIISSIEKRTLYLKNVKKSIDIQFTRKCYNKETDDYGETLKNRFKIILNSKILKGVNSYQYNGTKIGLLSVELRLYTNILSNIVTSLSYNRGIRCTLVFFPGFIGDINKLPTFRELFSGYNGFTGQELSNFSFSDISSSYTDSSIILFDEYYHLGSMSLKQNDDNITSSVVLRTNGNYMIRDVFDLRTLKTKFLVEEIEKENPELLYKNIISGFLVIYVSVNFYDNNNENDLVEIRGDARVNFVDE